VEGRFDGEDDGSFGDPAWEKCREGLVGLGSQQIVGRELSSGQSPPRKEFCSIQGPEHPHPAPPKRKLSHLPTKTHESGQFHLPCPGNWAPSELPGFGEAENFRSCSFPSKSIHPIEDPLFFGSYCYRTFRDLAPQFFRAAPFFFGLWQIPTHKQTCVPGNPGEFQKSFDHFQSWLPTIHLRSRH